LLQRPFNMIFRAQNPECNIITSCNGHNQVIR
jgi:hypothetical protein